MCFGWRSDEEPEGPGFLHRGAVAGVGEGGSSRGGSPLALGKKPGKEFMGAGRQVCVSLGTPDRQVPGCLVHLPRG